MTLNADERLPADYTHVYWNDSNSLPAPKGLFAKHLDKEKSHAIQRSEAAKLLNYINSAPQSYDDLAHTGLPFPMLVKVPGTHNVRFITGLAPLLQDAFQPADPSHGQLYALLQDIDKPDQDAKVLRLPRSALKLMDVMIPTEDQWFDKLVKKDNGQNIKSWFQQSAVKDNKEEMAMVCPCLPYWAYDAFTGDVPAHELWERIHVADTEGCVAVRTYAKKWLKAVHTAHNNTNINKIEIDAQFFLEFTGATASAWGRKRARTLYPSIQPQQITPPGGNNTNTTLALIAQLLAAQSPQTAAATAATATSTTATTTNFENFGMSDSDTDRMCIMCGLAAGQGAGLPSWFTKIAEKHHGPDGRKLIIRQLFASSVTYEEHLIPCTPAVLKMVIDKSFGGDGDTQTASGVMKGLSPYLFATQTAEEIAAATAYSDAVSTSTSTTVGDLQKLSKKARSPTTVPTLIDLLKTFANALEKLYNPGCPFRRRLIKDAIVPLVTLPPSARSIFSKESIAAVAWAVYSQSMFFVQGRMVGPNPLTPEWVQMTNSLKGGGRSLEIYSVPIALANRLAIIEESASEDEGPPLKTKKKKKKKRNKDQEDDGNEIIGKKPKITMELHPLIKEKITSVLPDFLELKKLCSLCDIKQHALFGDIRVCAFSALRGFCPYRQCRNSHDPAKITDEIAERTVAYLEPFLRNPDQLTEG